MGHVLGEEEADLPRERDHPLKVRNPGDVVEDLLLEEVPVVGELGEHHRVDAAVALDRGVPVDREDLHAALLAGLEHRRDEVHREVDHVELYYYGHEKQQQAERRIEYILVDSSASMRGVRQVFARGLALTLVKKLGLQGDEVWLRFFDSRLYEVARINDGGETAVPYLLCFRSERGRNYGRVFRQLLGELQRMRRHDSRPIVLYIVTHGQCHIPSEIVESLRQLVLLYGVFILPSQALQLDYLSFLHRYQVVSAEALSTRERSVDRALEIVDDVSRPVGSGA